MPDAVFDPRKQQYIDALKELFAVTKGFLIKVPDSVSSFREAEPEHAARVLDILVEKGLVYPTTYQRTQIRGDIDSIYNALSRAERWDLDKDIPEEFNPLWKDLCALYASRL